MSFFKKEQKISLPMIILSIVIYGFLVALRSNGDILARKQYGLGIFIIIFLLGGSYGGIYLKKYLSQKLQKGMYNIHISNQNKKRGWGDSTAVNAIQYLPPTEIETTLAFYLYYNDSHNPKIISAVIYYRLSKGRVQIKKPSGSDQGIYYITETLEDPACASDVDKMILKRFFGENNNILNTMPIDRNSYFAIQKVLATLYGWCKHSPFMEEKKMMFGVPYQILTQQGKEIIQHLHGYRLYLSKVEKNVIKKELEKDPQFINKIMPRLILFGLDTTIFGEIDSIIGDMQFIYDNSFGKLYKSTENQETTYSNLGSINFEL